MKKIQRIWLSVLAVMLVLALASPFEATAVAASQPSTVFTANPTSLEPAGGAATVVRKRRNPEAGKKKAAKRVGIGAAVGAGAGALLGGKKGALIGAASGAGGGYAYHQYKKHKARKRVAQ
ncbi:MAG TPA: YMGG-like glycine zipper-containing protein [Acidobacteriota bacterium]